jgi:hypothetical protein
VGCPLWQEDGSVVCIAISLWPGSLRTHNHTLLPHPRLAQLFPPDTRFPVYRLLQLAGLRWRYSNLFSTQSGPLLSKVKVKVIVQPTVSRPVRAGVGPWPVFLSPWNFL